MLQNFYLLLCNFKGAEVIAMHESWSLQKYMSTEYLQFCTHIINDCVYMDVAFVVG